MHELGGFLGGLGFLSKSYLLEGAGLTFKIKWIKSTRTGRTIHRFSFFTTRERQVCLMIATRKTLFRRQSSDMVLAMFLWISGYEYKIFVEGLNQLCYFVYILHFLCRLRKLTWPKPGIKRSLMIATRKTLLRLNVVLADDVTWVSVRDMRRRAVCQMRNEALTTAIATRKTLLASRLGSTAPETSMIATSTTALCVTLG